MKKATHKETGLSTAIKILKLPDLGKGGSNARGGKKARQRELSPLVQALQVV